jgi:hypothetical protein
LFELNIEFQRLVSDLLIQQELPPKTQQKPTLDLLNREHAVAIYSIQFVMFVLPMVNFKRSRPPWWKLSWIPAYRSRFKNKERLHH